MKRALSPSDQPKAKKTKCEHGRNRYFCRDCGGRGICEHGKSRYTCRDCNGPNICEHGRDRYFCVQCVGGGVCEHGRIYNKCTECTGPNICEHGRIRYSCVDCGGGGVCEHGRMRYTCKECHGAGICIHSKRRTRCAECGGSDLCTHGRIRQFCLDCDGTHKCEHGRLRVNCRICNAHKLMSCQHPGCEYQTLVKSELVKHENALHTAAGIAKRKKQEERFNKKLLAAGYMVNLNRNTTPLPLYFHREQRIDFKCLKDATSDWANIDFTLTEVNGILLFIEVDEDQHRFGDDKLRCDLKRMAYIRESLLLDGALQTGIIFLRYNPGCFKVDGVSQKGFKKEDREARLLEHIADIGRREVLPSVGEIEIQYAYYDRLSADATQPSICSDPDYNETYRTVAVSVCL